jgi:hypothetical protein
VCAAEHAVRNLDTVTNDPARAMVARRRNRLNGAFEAIENMPLPIDDDFEALIVLIATHFAGSHRTSFTLSAFRDVQLWVPLVEGKLQRSKEKKRFDVSYSLLVLTSTSLADGIPAKRRACWRGSGWNVSQALFARN